jgi:hypothetical protein
MAKPARGRLCTTPPIQLKPQEVPDTIPGLNPWRVSPAQLPKIALTRYLPRVRILIQQRNGVLACNP